MNNIISSIGQFFSKPVQDTKNEEKPNSDGKTFDWGDALDDDDYDELFGEDDEWEDSAYLQKLKADMPEGWLMIKINNFTPKKLSEIDEWCKANACGQYKRVGWSSNCAYSVAMQFENSKDAVLFKLMWS